MHIFLQQSVNGLVQGCLYAFIALGYSIIYKVIGMINYAHGDVFMFGTFASYSTWKYLGSPTGTSLYLYLPVMLLASIAATGTITLFMERFAYRGLNKKNPLGPLITSIGISIAIQEIVRIRYPDGNQGIAYPAIQGGSIGIFGVTLHLIDILIILSACIGGILLWVLVRFTRFGISMRAVSSDIEAASLVGTDVNKTVASSFLLGAVFASVGGVLYGLFLHQITYNMGYIIGMKAFTSAVLGGIGIMTALGGGIVLGLMEAFLVQYVGHIKGLEGFGGGAWRDVWSFLILIITLVALPSGLFSKTKMRSRV